MTELRELREHVFGRRYELGVGLIVSVVGFFAALTIDSWRQERAERAAFHALHNAVMEEARDNQHVYRFSFVPHVDSGIVVREFNLSTLRASLSNPVFVRHVSSLELEELALYLRNLELANGFAATVRGLRTMGDPARWSGRLVNGWKTNLSACSTSIDRVIEFDEP